MQLHFRTLSAILLVPCTMALLANARYSSASDDVPAAVAAMGFEVRALGWIGFSAPSGHGDWDLFAMRIDTSERHAITNTPEMNEAGIRFSPDGRKLLYYRMPRQEAVDNNTYGTWELVIADADGGRLVVYGRGYPWASWSPDGRQIAVLQRGGIQIVDLANRNIVRQLPRHGIVQQLVWSPDGQWLAGTANGLGPYWNVARIQLQTGAIAALSETDRYNCTPDWMPDSRRVLYARGIVPEQAGAAELWVADVHGQQRRLLYAEEGRNIYGACASPDGKFLLFTRSAKDLGPPDRVDIRMAAIRWDDIAQPGGFRRLLTRPSDKNSEPPWIDLGVGWEPHWTFAEIPGFDQAAP